MHDLLFIIYAFLALILLVLASPPHFRSGNVGACLLVLWAFVGTLGFLVNAIVWWDNVVNHAPVWCDIWIKIHVAISCGIASASLCINRRLMIISSAKRSNVSPREKRLEFWVDLAIGLVPPILLMPISYTVAGNRFDILEGMGCLPATYTDKYAIIGLFLPGLLMGVISFVYGALAVYNFTSRRLQFQTVLKQNGGGLNTSRFIRLVALSILEMLVSVPLSAYGLAWNAKSLQPFANWEDRHYDFSHVYLFNAKDALASPVFLSTTAVQRWIPVFAAFVYFAFFGMQDESITSYKNRTLWMAGLPRRAINKARGRSSSPSDSNVLPSRSHLPNLGSALAPVSPSTPYFPGRSADDIEHGGLSLKMTNDGEKDGSLGYKPSGIAVRVERTVA